MNVEQFALAYLPPSPSQVLEVGCGSGQLARALVDRGYGITAIDPEAPEGEMFRQTSLEDFSEPGPFDAVVASRSLHHVHDLGPALDKIQLLLGGRGVLIVNEFAWDQMNDKTAHWYLSHVEEPGPEVDSLLPGRWPQAWAAEHEGLHGAATMRRLLDERFRSELFEWEPYIAEYYLKRPGLTDEERALIHSGAINAIGFRYVGRPKMLRNPF